MTAPRSVVITGFSRTPFGSFLGGLSHLTAPELGSYAIKNALKSSRIDASEVSEVIMGHVLPAGCGQAPVRQAALGAGIPESVDAWSVNKVCSSGMKAISLGAQSIQLGLSEVVVCGGMESMSNVPHYLNKSRSGGYRYGHAEMPDGLLTDGLTDPYSKLHMGECCESTMQDMGITRGECDQYATKSYSRTSCAWREGVMANEVVPVPGRVVRGQQGPSITEDEDYKKFQPEKVGSLKLAFPLANGQGTITAANASNLNDGAAAVVLMSAEKAKSLKITPKARILSYADAAVKPIDFAIAPHQAAKIAMSRAGLDTVDFYEFNEAFSGVVLANIKLGGIDPSRVNLHGGAVSLGHPLGASGCRVVMSLINVLNHHNGATGLAAICNGGGGASAITLTTHPDKMSAM
eukprot:GHVN01006659.1.p1 GENE.GHVN01006659.1~~GHVN01006659.1.p1  ORF type:complete len:406 (+),score=88.84 GHVN01006659.1:146-1363(+)